MNLKLGEKVCPSRQEYRLIEEIFGRIVYSAESEDAIFFYGYTGLMDFEGNKVGYYSLFIDKKKSKMITNKVSNELHPKVINMIEKYSDQFSLYKPYEFFHAGSLSITICDYNIHGLLSSSNWRSLNIKKTFKN